MEILSTDVERKGNDTFSAKCTYVMYLWKDMYPSAELRRFWVKK